MSNKKLTNFFKNLHLCSSAKTRLILFTFLILTFLTTPLISQIKELTFKQFKSTDSGLYHYCLNCILQDDEGFLWFGTNNGLSRYDGYHFKEFRYKKNDNSSLNSNSILSLFQRKNGTIWIGTDAGICILDKKTGIITRFFEYSSGKHEKLNHRIMDIKEDNKGVLWIGTATKGIIKYDDSNNEVSFLKHNPNNKNSLNSNIINRILIDQNNNIWIATGSGLNLFNNKKNTFFSLHSNLLLSSIIKNQYLIELYEDKHGYLWVSAINGLFRLKFQKGVLKEQKQILLPNNYQGRSTYILTIKEGSNNRLWLGTRHGIKLLDRDTWGIKETISGYTLPKSFRKEYILSFLKDKTGLLWAGSLQSGIYQLNPEVIAFNFQSNPPSDSSLTNSIHAILEENPTFLWVGTDYGLYRYNRFSGKHQHYLRTQKHPDSIINNHITSLIKDKSNNIWIGTWNGLNKFDVTSKKFSFWINDPDNQNSISSNQIYSLHQANDGNIYIGTNNGLNKFNPETKQFTCFYYSKNQPDSLNCNSIHSISEDNNNNLWIGSYGGGLNKMNLKNNKFSQPLTSITPPFGNTVKDISCLYWSHEHLLYIGTPADGLLIFNPKNKTLINCHSENNNLRGDSIRSILSDSQNNIWISTEHGISKFNPILKKFQNYGHNDGHQANIYNTGSSFSSTDGKLFFGGMTGFIAFYPRDIKTNNHIPDISITSIFLHKSDGQLKINPKSKSLTMSYKDSVTFEFSALDFTNPSNNQYAYMLNNFHKNWINIKNRHSLTMANLKPGKYFLKIKGSNNHGIWSKNPVGIHIVVSPPFYGTIWFKFILIIVSFTLLYWIYKKKVQRITSRLQFIHFCNEKKFTQREIQIFKLVLKGKSNKEIENELFISLGTVKTYCYTIYKKLKVKNRVHLVTTFKNLKP